MLSKKEAELLKRRKTVFVCADDVAQVLFNNNKNKIRLIDAHLPKDAKVVGVHSSFRKNGFWICLISKEFPVVEEEKYAPEIKDSGLRIIRKLKPMECKPK